jgi:Ribbon-helix-helix domain
VTYPALLKRLYARILELSAGQAKAANAEIHQTDLMAIVIEAIEWARSREH